MPGFYRRAGVPWDDDEVDELLRGIQDGTSTYEFALQHERSHSAVVSRLALCYDEGRIEVTCHRELHPNRFLYDRDAMYDVNVSTEMISDVTCKSCTHKFCSIYYGDKWKQG